MAVAREVRRGGRAMGPAGRRHRQESSFPA
jgi:hypothetical protein